MIRIQFSRATRDSFRAEDTASGNFSAAFLIKLSQPFLDGTCSMRQLRNNVKCLQPRIIFSLQVFWRSVLCEARINIELHNGSATVDVKVFSMQILIPVEMQNICSRSTRWSADKLGREGLKPLPATASLSVQQT